MKECVNLSHDTINIHNLTKNYIRQNSMGSTDLFDKFIPQVRGLCDPIYSEAVFNPRTRYYSLGISLIESLVQTLINESHQRGSGGVAATAAAGASTGSVPDLFDEFLENLSQTFEDPSIEQDLPVPVEITGPHRNVAGGATNASADPTIDPLRLHHASSSSHDVPMGATATSHQPHPALSGGSYTIRPTPATSFEPPHTRLGGAATSSSQQGEAAAVTTTVVNENPTAAVSSSSAGGTPAPIMAPYPSSAAAVVTSGGPFATTATSSKIEAEDCCEVCGYRPKGDPQWFKGSMAKHKKLQHSSNPPVMYHCPFPGCTSAYRNRPDNLRQHQIEKAHFVGDGGGGSGSSGGGPGGSSGDEPAVASTRRPSKKRKKGEE